MRAPGPARPKGPSTSYVAGFPATPSAPGTRLLVSYMPLANSRLEGRGKRTRSSGAIHS